METNSNEAILGVDYASIDVTETLGVFFKVYMPVTNISFRMTYDPEVFSLVLGSLECSFTQYIMDTNTPGVIVFNGSCDKEFAQDTTVVRFAFKPKQACEHSEFHLFDVSTVPASELVVPTQVVQIRPAEIHYAEAQRMKDDTDNQKN